MPLTQNAESPVAFSIILSGASPRAQSKGHVVEYHRCPRPKRAEAEETHLAGLVRGFNNLENDRKRAQDNLQKLNAEHKWLVEGRPGWLEASRASWRDRNYTSSMIIEIGFVIADYPAPRGVPR